MAWTNPRTWVSGETLTAALLNVHVRDNLKAIGDPWTTYTPTFVGLTTTGVVAKYVASGKWIVGRVGFQLSAAPTADVTVSLPVTASTVWGTSATVNIGMITGLRTGVSFHVAGVFLASSTTAGFISNGAGGMWAPGQPVAWAADDRWSFNFSYEAA